MNHGSVKGWSCHSKHVKSHCPKAIKSSQPSLYWGNHGCWTRTGRHGSWLLCLASCIGCSTAAQSEKHQPTWTVDVENRTKHSQHHLQIVVINRIVAAWVYRFQHLIRQQSQQQPLGSPANCGATHLKLSTARCKEKPMESLEHKAPCLSRGIEMKTRREPGGIFLALTTWKLLTKDKPTVETKPPMPIAVFYVRCVRVLSASLPSFGPSLLMLVGHSAPQSAWTCACQTLVYRCCLSHSSCHVVFF